MSRTHIKSVIALATLAILFGNTPAASGQEWWWPPSLTVQPPEPTTADPITVTLSGLWPDTCVPKDSAIWPPVGGLIHFDLYWNYPDGTFCASVITPWARSESPGPLAAGTYGVIATLFRQVGGPVWLGPTPVGTFDVRHAWPLGDLNCDGTVDFADIDPFVLALAGQGAYEARYPHCRWLNADCNGDGNVDFADIDPFVALLTGGPHVSEYGNSGCRREGPCTLDDHFVLTVQGTTLHVLHLNATYNCCPDDIVVSLTIEGDLLTFTEEEILNAPCFCTCCYDVHATVVDLTPGTYTVDYWWFDYETNELRCHSEQIVVP